VSNAIQTNAALLDDDWARFLKQSGFLVGVSLDGPADMHNRYRKDRNGGDTFNRVVEGIEHLRRHEVPFNILTVVSQSNVEQPRELLLWLAEHGFYDLQFIPCVEVQPGYRSVKEGSATEESVTPEQYGRFLIGLLGAWLEVGVERVRIRWFDNLVQMLWGFPNEMCELARTCGYVVLEHNGDCYPCDFFVEENWRLGNIHNEPLLSMLENEKHHRFSQAKARLHTGCVACPWLTLCHGECPRYRIINEGRAENGLPYLCPSLKEFFGHSYRRLEQVAVRTGRAMGLAVPDGHMPAGERTRTRAMPVADVRKQARKAGVGRNDSCPCGSGKKYKRCCGADTRSPGVT